MFFFSENLHDVMISLGKQLLLVICTLLTTTSFGTTGNIFKQTAGHVSCSLHGQLGLGYYMEILIGDTAQLVIMQLYCVICLYLIFPNDLPLYIIT